MRKSIVAVALTAAASLMVAGVAPATAATSAEDKGVTLAKAIVAKYNKTPTSIGITTPLKKVPPKGKYVIALSNGGDENKVLDEAINAAAKSLGWKYKELVGAVTPETQRSLFSQALSLKPNYIHISGIEPSTLSDLLVKADKQGVVVVCSACMSKPVAALKDTHMSGPKMLDLWGQMIAAYTVASTNGNAKVQGVTVPLYPILIRFDQSYEKNLKRLCPSKCTYEANPQQLTDIFAGKTPAAVVNIVNSNPGTNWIVSDLGGWVTGVSAAPEELQHQRRADRRPDRRQGEHPGRQGRHRVGMDGLLPSDRRLQRRGQHGPPLGRPAVRDERPAHADPHQAERQDAGAHPRG